MKTTQNPDGSYTTTASLGEALYGHHFDNVNDWTPEQKAYFDKMAKERLDGILCSFPSPIIGVK